MKHKKITILSRRDFLGRSAGLAAGALALTGGGRMVRAAGVGPGVSEFTVREKGKLRVLAVTDLHLQKKDKDARTLGEIKKMVEKFQPELIVMDGDNWYENPDGRGLEFCRFTAESFAQLGIPWTCVRGNHDQADDFGKCEEILGAASFSLYPGRTQDGNYRLEIKDPDQTPLWNLILVNDAAPTLGFTDERIAWLQAEAARIHEKFPTPPPAFLFAHIPLPQFGEMVKAGQAKGIKGEKVSYEQGSAQALAAIKETGMTQAMFCGHDHLNNFHGTWEGVRLEYLRATGHSGYGGARLKKGGVMITVDRGRTPAFDTITVFPSGRTWQPKSMIVLKK